ncbi:hypothetical protein F2B00_20965 [Streptomyces parvus]|uniref:hypothetical protein n=1 Tax=Streptomyces parvus TaxID=66428 RepID=UPI00123C2235|nr:hypothetical protein [Streptomyces parvus]KAA6200296.1 hypothetical protein F2B00_20965 [Streptomyces parvus]GGS12141.1 hypothetical protein GCM10010221_05840 [Streptomyces parvus]
MQFKIMTVIIVLLIALVIALAAILYSLIGGGSRQAAMRTGGVAFVSVAGLGMVITAYLNPA